MDTLDIPVWADFATRLRRALADVG